jgi:hypothetical protein
MFNMANSPNNNTQRIDVNNAPQLPQSLQYKPRQGNLAANYGLYDDYMPVIPQNNTMANGTPMQNQIQLGNQLLDTSVNKTDDTPNPLDNTKKPAVKKPGFLSDGDKISLYGNLAGMVPKAIEAFGKTQVEPYRLQNTPITQQQMDPTNALYNSSKEYRDMLYNVNDTSGTLAGANSMRQAAFASKLGADNSIISQYDEKNKGLQTQYEERLAQRQGANNASMMQTDDLNSRNRGASQQMRMGVYSDIQGMAQFLGNTKNQRAKDEMMVKLRAKLSPEIMAKLAKDDPTLYEYLHGEVMPKKETKTN